MPLANLRDRLLLLVLLTALPALGLMLYTNLEERRVAAAEVQANALRLARVTAQHHEQLVVACRYGGEEFVLILPATALADTCRRADELQETIRELRVSYRGQLLGPVRCSMGVSSFPTHGAMGETLLRAADTALYRAKHAGRDQVMVAE